MKGRKLLCAAIVLLVLTANIQKTWSYFTTYALAQGGYTIELGDRTELAETFSAWTKHVTIHSDEGSQPVYVRVRAFCGSAYDLVYSDSTGNWTPNADGYYYYNSILPGGADTDTLDIRIDNVPTDLTEPEEFHVVVIYETTPVCYDQAGTPYADWDGQVDRGTLEGGGDQ
jgi:hypothetical protein